MKIGIDAKWFFDGPPSGRVVVKNIVKELLTYNKKDEFYLFLNKSDKNKPFPFLDNNVTLIYIKNINNALSNVFLLPQYSRKLKLDVILYQNFSAVLTRSKSINYIHDVLFLDFPEYYTLKERIYLWPIKYLSKFSNHIITISESEKKRIIRHNFMKKEAISVVYHGINKDYEQTHSQESIRIFKEKYNLPKKFILYFGRLNYRKNISTLLKSLKDIKDISLVIAGKADHEMANLKNAITKLNLEERVLFTGYIQDDDVIKLYASAHIFCFPSFAEGFGLPPLESMASGTPVIVSNTTSLPEICANAVLYINPNDATDIANKINTLLQDENMYLKLANLGKERAKKFSWETTAEQINNIFNIVGCNEDR
ncbi:glycosyl transferase group 1 [Cellulophaga algicola DSM 14237]|uniref:Glycosyl transferase group 1 n=1 Tax=Cellulophaga algicola (strain DSM 14237 / IC166 / ACAM 630) TaxID=688270 RepID=E6XB31_CELAD|nr:glycosyltransferase family 1 protein [Cellulophaga algicola]ADV48887.1 glycosyl transferase group 1 [Cellulophaga algicola DSM 14237]